MHFRHEIEVRKHRGFLNSGDEFLLESKDFGDTCIRIGVTALDVFLKSRLELYISRSRKASFFVFTLSMREDPE